MVDEGVEQEELYIQGFDFNLFGEYREGCVGDDLKEFLILKFLLSYGLWIRRSRSTG